MSAIATEPVRVISPAENLTVVLRSSEEGRDARGAKFVIEKGVTVRFTQGRADLTPEQWDLMQEHPVYTGQGSPRLVYLEGEAMAGGPARPRVVHGALGAASTAYADEAPSEDWDSTPVVPLAKRVTAGEFDAVLRGAIDYELGARKRKTVLDALVARLTKGAAATSEDGLGPVDDEGPALPITDDGPPEVPVPDDMEGI